MDLESTKGTQLTLGSESTPPRAKRVVRNGSPSNDLVLSAYSAANEDVFPKILDLYVAPGSTVADVTYGKGVFWNKVSPDRYNLLPTDIATGVDCRDLPYENGSIDCVVLDPPYMHSPGGTAYSTHQPYESYYKNNSTGNRTRSKYHEAVLDLYVDGGREAYRVLRERGTLIVKCQDEVCSNRQRFTHVEIIREYASDVGHATPWTDSQRAAGLRIAAPARLSTRLTIRCRLPRAMAGGPESYAYRTGRPS